MLSKICLCTLAAMTAASHADVMTQVVSFNSGFNGTNIDFEMFDTMGGTRELTGLSLSYDQSMSLTLTAESNGYTGISAGDWMMDTGFISIHQFGLNDGGAHGRGGDDEPGPPFIGPGAIFDSITADLGASDGYNGTGPDAITTTISDSYIWNASYDGSEAFDQRMFDAFTGSGTLTTFMGGFSELLFEWVNDPNWVLDPNNPPDGPWDNPFIDPYYGIFVSLDELVHAGDITLTYEYRAVPGPSSFGLLGAMGFIGIRRRRTH